jgi:hypothetical protein
MVAHYRSKAMAGIWIGFLMQFASLFTFNVMRSDKVAALPEEIIFLVLFRWGGIVLNMWGCAMYAKAKGRSAAYFWMGLFGLIGACAIMRMEDLAPDGVAPDDPRGFDGLPGRGPAQPSSGARPYF